MEAETTVRSFETTSLGLCAADRFIGARLVHCSCGPFQRTNCETTIISDSDNAEEIRLVLWRRIPAHSAVLWLVCKHFAIGMDCVDWQKTQGWPDSGAQNFA